MAKCSKRYGKKRRRARRRPVSSPSSISSPQFSGLRELLQAPIENAQSGPPSTPPATLTPGGCGAGKSPGLGLSALINDTQSCGPVWIPNAGGYTGSTLQPAARPTIPPPTYLPRSLTFSELKRELSRLLALGCPGLASFYFGPDTITIRRAEEW